MMRIHRNFRTWDLSNVRILGRVSGVGDVLVKIGDWIAGLGAPARIEGIAVEWLNKPADIDFQYAVKIEGATHTATSFVEPGKFVGASVGCPWQRSRCAVRVRTTNPKK